MRALPPAAASLLVTALLAVPALPGGAGYPEGGREPGPPRPNILFVSLDTTRADFLTFEDSDTSEHMTALARRGTIFTQAIAGTSWTLPTHAQMFTGMAPPYHGTESIDVAIDPLFPILPEILHDAGYYTAGVFTSRYLWGDYGFARGFEFYRSGILREDRARAGPGLLSPRGAEEEGPWLVKSSNYVSSENVVALTRMALERAPADRPVFLFAHFFDPHSDYVPPPPWDTRFDPDYDGPITGRDMFNNRQIFDPVTPPYRRVDDRGLEHLRALYRGEIAWTDQAVGKLIAMLEEHRRLDDTLIVIASDHGEEFFEHGTLTHRMNLFDETIRVPMLIVTPASWGLDVKREVDAQVTLSDLLPTILDFLEIEIPPGATGRSLRPAMEGTSFASRPELISLYVSNPGPGGVLEHMQTYGLRTPEWKFTRSVILKPGEPMLVRGEYYDLVREPGEKRVLINQQHPLVREHWALLEAELQRARAAWKNEPRTRRAARSTDLTTDLLAELRALGYVEQGDPTEAPELRRPWGLQPMDPVEIMSDRGWTRYSVVPVLLALAVLVYWMRRRARSST